MNWYNIQKMQIEQVVFYTLRWRNSWNCSLDIYGIELYSHSFFKSTAFILLISIKWYHSHLEVDAFVPTSSMGIPVFVSGTNKFNNDRDFQCSKWVCFWLNFNTTVGWKFILQKIFRPTLYGELASNQVHPSVAKWTPWLTAPHWPSATSPGLRF